MMKQEDEEDEEAGRRRRELIRKKKKGSANVGRERERENCIISFSLLVAFSIF